MKKTHIFFLDPGLPLKIDVLESPAHFFARVRMEKAYTCAEFHFEGVRYSAWRPIAGEWVEGTFVDSVREACRQRGCTLPEGCNLRQLRDLIDYEGMSLVDVAEFVEKNG